MATNIVQKDDPVLRKTAEDVPVTEIKSAKIKKVLKDMASALASQEDGVALAAPQIGEPLRIFIVSGATIRLLKHGEKEDAPMYEDQIYINPKITKLSKDKEEMEEGCLSIRWLYGYVKRSKKATVEAYDEHGKKFTRGGSGLMAQIFQHEVDHLDGVLFTDKAKGLRESPPEEKQ
ncbi:MAG: peptide deformylase [Candidatus Zambryskibacteria bacterium CG10_big_fil_rev_8_21_14_0_10_42_12]|uniref:Peptide deformylase n=1 Tax=Candidatus Zambryskibacteria bacterium CG10_big_fil_rev_8_21_14_0_10_42_12 TaxID=1975115 RepID=A0A2H0QVR1_9BACT|nr:MAG: peptide deformylase [Candidatus Zambryskibacteria bacterium CG10_big_fil_rev_8_21_14_0_10_42_12]